MRLGSRLNLLRFKTIFLGIKRILSARFYVNISDCLKLLTTQKLVEDVVQKEE